MSPAPADGSGNHPPLRYHHTRLQSRLSFFSISAHLFTTDLSIDQLGDWSGGHWRQVLAAAPHLRRIQLLPASFGSLVGVFSFFETIASRFDGTGNTRTSISTADRTSYLPFLERIELGAVDLEMLVDQPEWTELTTAITTQEARLMSVISSSLRAQVQQMGTPPLKEPVLIRCENATESEIRRMLQGSTYESSGRTTLGIIVRLYIHWIDYRNYI